MIHQRTTRTVRKNAVSIRLLGECHVGQNGRFLPHVPFGFYRIIAFLLLDNTDRSVLRWRIGRLLWSEATAEAASADLRQVIARIRRFQAENGFNYVVADAERLHLAADDNVSCDLVAFLAMLGSSDPAAAVEACRLYDGRMLEAPGIAGNEFEEWLTMRREQIRERFIDTVSRSIAPDSGLDRRDREFCARHLLTVDAYQEDAYRALMQLAAESGQMSAVHQIYADCRRRLSQDLGIAPNRATVQLFDQLVERSGPENGRDQAPRDRRN